MSPALAGLIGALVALAVVAVGYGISRGIRARRDLSGPAPGSEATPDLSRIIAALNQGAILVGSHDEVLASNDAGAAMGIVRGARVGFKELLALVREVRDTGHTYKGAIAREREPGEEPMDLTGRVVPLDDGMVLVITEDETASRRIDAVRRDFVANVSHELKTPIGAIAILAEAIEAASDDPEQVSNFVRRLHVESNRLGELVSQIIDLSRLQSSDHTALEEVVEIDEVIDEALNRSRVLAANRGVNLIRARAASFRVQGNSWQLADAVTNLVQNAIVYSDVNARVAVTVVGVAEDGEEFVDIKVADNGIGIEPEDQSRIFERFYRVDYGRSRESGGTGLGLSIVRHIALSHGGSIRVWSKPHQGSTFTLRLPIQSAEADPDIPEDEELIE
ncbi:two-component sensor histidine kinase [Tessaracoccus rhinocerotis]|uniref:Sensor-like histidine kinase SenX3 n=1 Tax=Tessaracoccus rhinocerotis TaxID=1689449 RepID=A0A553K628_9ACTN|nr:ATP-binding protein [Tessaracoccus rhinocerotis]TRY20141.1 two-component sensor histidine kinase [Tessaracoccus rhinocerotis]